jgi:hypothetical protein
MTASPSSDYIYGYTITQIQELAQRAARLSRSRILPFQDRYELACSGMMEYLTACITPPCVDEVFFAGRKAIDRESTLYFRGHGIDSQKYTGANFYRYWTRPKDTPLDEMVIERIAVRQILSALTPEQREVILALAEHGTEQAGAGHLGITPQAFNGRLARARRILYRQWVEPETPRKKWGRDDSRQVKKNLSARFHIRRRARRRHRDLA